MEPVAQLVRALVCGTRGRGFNSHQAPIVIDLYTPRSSRGPGRRPFTAVARVQIPYAVQSTGHLFGSVLFLYLKAFDQNIYPSSKNNAFIVNPDSLHSPAFQSHACNQKCFSPRRLERRTDRGMTHQLI